MISRQRALKLLGAAGMPWRFIRPSDVLGTKCPFGERIDTIRHSWTGSELIVTARRTGTDLVHELSHWLIAGKHRAKPEFGLGRSVWDDMHWAWGDMHWAKSRTTPATILAEERASLLDIFIHALLRGGWRERAAHLNMDAVDDEQPLAAYLKAPDGLRYTWPWLVHRGHAQTAVSAAGTIAPCMFTRSDLAPIFELHNLRK